MNEARPVAASSVLEQVYEASGEADKRTLLRRVYFDLIGLPPSGAFLAKWELLSSAFETGQWPWIVVVALGSLLAAAYTFRVLGHAFGPGEGVTHVLAWSREEIPALLLALIATLVLGLGAAFVWQFEPPAASRPKKMTRAALMKLAKEDPSFRVHTDEESNQTIISGMAKSTKVRPTQSTVAPSAIRYSDHTTSITTGALALAAGAVVGAGCTVLAEGGGAGAVAAVGAAVEAHCQLLQGVLVAVQAAAPRQPG